MVSSRALPSSATSRTAPPARDEDAYGSPWALPSDAPTPLVIATTYDPATPYPGRFLWNLCAPAQGSQAGRGGFGNGLERIGSSRISPVGASS
jgi:hypothetical protein